MAALGAERRDYPAPRCTELTLATIALIVAGGINMASHIPHRVPLAPAWGLLAAAALCYAASWAVLARAEGFAWRRFWTVFRWALLAYAVSAGMIEYVFIYDGVRGATLGVLSGMLALFALDVPFSIAYTVARCAAD